MRSQQIQVGLGDRDGPYRWRELDRETEREAGPSMPDRCRRRQQRFESLCPIGWDQELRAGSLVPAGGLERLHQILGLVGAEPPLVAFPGPSQKELGSFLPVRLIDPEQSPLHIPGEQSVEVVEADAFAWVRTSPSPFDVVLADFPDPEDPATAKLYSVEFYELVRDRLAPGGVLAQWVASPRTLNSATEVFPEPTVPVMSRARPVARNG